MSKTFRVAELDFDTIKTNLKDFLRQNPTFTDYDFDGSGLSVMLDVLAYNTHYNAIIANMLTQEMFLDTAVKRETVSLHAKRLGYLPRSIRSAKANVSIEVFPTDNPSVITLGKNASFSSGGQIQFNFVNLNSVTTTRNSSGRYIFDSVDLQEGRIETFRYIVSNDIKKFQIPNKNADISLLKVFVQPNNTNTDRIEYKLYDSIVDVTSNSNAYFVQVNYTGYYEVYFGDGVIGNQVENGSVVTLEYVVCNGEIPNGAGAFRINDQINGYSNISVTTLSKAFGGAQAESVDSIKENAYKRLLNQNRAVCVGDFSPIIQQIYPNGSDVSVWGGENNSPPVYGKVFFSILKGDNPSQFLDSDEKQYILNEVKKKMMVSVVPEIVDPDLLFVEIICNVYFDQIRTTNTSQQIKTLVNDSIVSYVNTKLNKFSTELRGSNLSTAIDSSDRSINSNITRYVLKKSVIPVYNQYTNYRIDFKNPIRESSEIISNITSNSFYVQGETDLVYIDDLAGSIRLYKLVNGAKTILRNIGSVNYSTGVITLNSLMITSVPDGSIVIRCNPTSNDIVAINNTALLVNSEDITINIISESATPNHIFTSSF